VIRVGINARVLMKPTPAGVSQYTHNLLSALAERSVEHDDCEYVVFGIDGLPDALTGYDRIWSADEPASAHSGLSAHYWEQLTLPRTLRRYDLDVFHTPAGQPPVFSTVPLVTTVHDISPVVHPEWFSRSYAVLYRVLTPLAVRTSDRIVSVTGFSRDELVSVYPCAADKTSVVYNGVIPPSTDGDRPTGELQSGEFLLFVGAANRRKNLRTLLAAYRQYREGTDDPVPLALAGPSRDVFKEPIYTATEGIHTLGYVSVAELGWLYHNATAFVFPSLYEGFGLPILEAMTAGTPVITSDRGAMAEIAGDDAHLVDPLRPTQLADDIERVLSDDAYRSQLSERGRTHAEEFTWKRTATQTAAVYREVAEQ
jgi:glycosyltransferase involved in cell wall biosynthesis